MQKLSNEPKIFLKISIINFIKFCQYSRYLVENGDMGYTYDISIVKPSNKPVNMDFMGRAVTT